jgi:hypothetical protein
VQTKVRQLGAQLAVLSSHQQHVLSLEVAVHDLQGRGRAEQARARRQNRAAGEPAAQARWEQGRAGQGRAGQA